MNKCFPLFLYFLVLSTGGIVFGYHHTVKYFDSAKNEGEYIPDVSLQSRAKHVTSMCYKLFDVFRPEHLNASFIHWKTKPLSVTPDQIVWIESSPPVELCTPFGVADVFLENLKKMLVHEDNLFKKKPFRTLLIVHPFSRLVSVFKSLNEGTKFYKDLKATIQQFSPNSNLSFKIFVRFIMEANRNTSNVKSPETKEILKKLLPFHYHCPVCQKDAFPQFVLKLDDHFDEDFESFIEDTGLDEIGVTKEMFNEIQTPTKKDIQHLFSQLGKEDVDDLIQKYRVDLEMYRYSTKEYFEYAS